MKKIFVSALTATLITGAASAAFADKLNSLGVRVSALEKKVDNVKWRGTLAYVYSNEQLENDGGRWGAYVAYRKLGGWASIMPTYDAMTVNQKGWELGLDYVPMKNFMTTFKYFRGKDLAWAAPLPPKI